MDRGESEEHEESSVNEMKFNKKRSWLCMVSYYYYLTTSFSYFHFSSPPFFLCLPDKERIKEAHRAPNGMSQSCFFIIDPMCGMPQKSSYPCVSA
jgi:hypothetical protein